MALSGTLKDFGIADILQLIGHQTKTGSLLLKNAREEVEVSFIEGNVVFASAKVRETQDFLGALLLRADLLTEQQLEQALQQQQRSLKRLGDILLELKLVSRAALSQMMRLQTTETLYKLFRWKDGTYEFTQREIDAGKGSFDPIRAESILLEGFRRVDEWPAVRKRIPWDDATCERTQDLDLSDLPPLADGGLAPDAEGEGEGKPSARHKLIYRLAEPGRTVRKIADMARMGEFETLKAMNQLVDWNYLRILPPARGTAAAVKGLAEGGRTLAGSGLFARVLLAAVVFAATLLLGRAAGQAFAASRAEAHARRGAAARLLARDQIVRIEGALEVYRVEHGEYPAELRALIDDRVLAEGDLSYPFPEPYSYRRTGQGPQQGFVLLPPLD
ncbi:MAG: hypothetical protein NVS2B9_09110 [Myxococcales bacterium]